MTATTTTRLQKAKTKRDAELAQAQDEYTEACRRINETFADVVRKAAEDTSVSKIAEDLGINRQNLHRILRVGVPA